MSEFLLSEDYIIAQYTVRHPGMEYPLSSVPLSFTF